MATTPELTPLEDAQARLADYRACELAIIGGAQEYTIGSGQTARRLVRPRLEDVRAVIAEIKAEITGLTPSPFARRRVTYLRPLR
jgi:hypothetical protein